MRSRTLVAAWGILSIVASGTALAAKPQRSTTAPAAVADYPSPADRLFQQALAAEAAGNIEDRDALLDKVLDADPKHAGAHWHRGEVLVGGKWLTVDDAAKQIAASGKIFDYNNRRTTAGNSAADQLALAQWCAAAGLPEQQRFHALQAMAADPSIADARAALGMSASSGMWLSPGEIAERQRQAARNQEKMEKWNKQLTGWLRDIKKSHNKETVQAAREQVRSLTDPTAIPALEQIFSIDSLASAQLVIEAVSNMPQQSGTDSLIRHAVLSPWEEVRSAAALSLKNRSLYSYAPLLLSGLASPIEADFAFVEEGPGTWRYRCTLFREGPMADAAMDLQVSVRPNYAPQTGSGQDLLDAKAGLELPSREQGFNAAQSISSSAFGVDAAGIQQANQFTLAMNERIINVLKVTTDAGQTPPTTTQEAQLTKSNKDSKADSKPKSKKSKKSKRNAEPLKQSTSLAAATDQEPRYWWKWWYDHNDIYYTEGRPTENTYRQFQATYQPVIRQPQTYQQPTQQPTTSATSRPRVTGTNRTSECFVAGTPVYTPTGDLGIELVQPGDLVLAQHPETGELAFKAVVATTVRPPAQLFRIQLEQGELVVTRGHPLWVSGKGWRMARELAVGDRLHTPNGTVSIKQIEVAPRAEAYNLVVADFNTYFAGPDRVLAHDNNLRQPTDTVVPGLAAKD